MRQLLEKIRGGGAVCDLSACQEESDGAALSIRERMDFRCSAAARPTYRLALLPPLFPPDAERCAFTAELSMSTCAGGPSAVARIWNNAAQTPFSAHLTNRL